MTMLLQGNGRFDFKVAGTSFCEDVLFAIAGPLKPDGHEMDCLAALIFDDMNSFDPNAVGVFVVFKTGAVALVGYLSKTHARQYRKSVASVGGPDPEGMLCRARIVGGRAGYFDAYDNYVRSSSYGLQLDLMLPIRLGAEESWKTWQHLLLSPESQASVNEVIQRNTNGAVAIE